ncbi:hypothetical protein K439DRAFT_1333012, partial [Ramaria rubella]
PFRVDIGHTVFDLTYKGVFLGQGMNSDAVIVCPLLTTSPHRLIPHNRSSLDLKVFGELFSNYLNGTSAPVIA